jgi:hypothetical protein
MRVGVIRGDLPGPIFLADLEPTSQINFSVDPPGQTQYLEYPSPTALTNFLAGLSNDGLSNGLGGVMSGVEGSSAVTFPLTLTGSNNVLRVKTSSGGSFTAVTIPAATYASMTTLLAAANTALTGAGVAATATTDTATGTLFVLQSTAVGVGAYIAYDTTGDGSTFNTPAHLVSGGASFTMPTASTIITALLPVGGPLNVSAANLLSTLGASPSVASVANVIAPEFVESDVALKSFQVGNLAGYLLPNFNPDPRLVPLPAYGPAITVVENDGTTLFTYPLPSITGAVHNSPNTGDITITGVGLGNSEYFSSTAVLVTNPTTGATVKVNQELIVNTVSGGTTGSVSSTSIVIPASILNGFGVAGNTVEVKFESTVNCISGSSATISSAVLGVSTITGLTGMSAASVGSFIRFSNCNSPSNNGTFRVLSYISSSSVTVGNPNGFLPEANNGSIDWVNFPVAFTVT